MDTEKTAAIRLPYDTSLLDGLYAVAQHASKDQASLVLCVVSVGARTFIATDRQTMGEWTHTPEGGRGR